jgi:hypothetical protein
MKPGVDDVDESARGVPPSAESILEEIADAVI